MKTSTHINSLKALSIIALGIALTSSFGVVTTLPFAYYQLMNWSIVTTSLLVVAKSYRTGRFILLWIFAPVAIVFNPITPIYLSTLGWQIANGVVVFLFLISFLMHDGEKKIQTTTQTQAVKRV